MEPSYLTSMVRVVILCLFIFFEEIPHKAKDEYEIKFDLSFKQRPFVNETTTVHLNETRGDQERRTNSDLLPYLVLRVKILKLQPEEVKIKAIRDGSTQVFNKKVATGAEFKLDLGFTDDIKDGISGYKHVIQFLSADKKTTSQILIEFDKEGNYMVNGEKRGKI